LAVRPEVSKDEREVSHILAVEPTENTSVSLAVSNSHGQTVRLFFADLIVPPFFRYCAAPQTWQTDAHRLMRDRQRRHILKRVRHHKNEEAAAVKMRIKIFWIMASRLLSETFLSYRDGASIETMPLSFYE
jgi:hypothetical protein